MVTLPPKETWAKGLYEGAELADKIIKGFDGEQKITTLEPGSAPTENEIKLALSVLVAERMVTELKADVLYCAMQATRIRNNLKMFEHQNAGKHANAIFTAVLDLGKVEGRGKPISTAWIKIDLHLKKWREGSFWFGKKPWKEVDKLLGELFPGMNNKGASNGTIKKVDTKRNRTQRLTQSSSGSEEGPENSGQQIGKISQEQKPNDSEASTTSENA